jgi:hypothetical protein
MSFKTRGQRPNRKNNKIKSKSYNIVHMVRYFKVLQQEVTKRCRLSWLTNSALVYEPKYEGGGGVVGPKPMSKAVHRSPNKL